jgi:hypothetical protein
MTEFGDRVQRRTFQPKKKKVVGLLQKNVYNEVLYHFTLHKILGTKIKGGSEMDCTCFMLRKN